MIRAAARREGRTQQHARAGLERSATKPLPTLVAALCIAAVLLWALFLARQALLTVYVSIALLIGGSLLGVLGVILALPTAAIVQVMLQHALDDR